MLPIMTSKLFSFIAGAFFSLLWTQLPSVYLTIGLAVLSILLLKKVPNIACILIGIVWMASVGHWTCSLQLKSEDFSQGLWVTGQIEGLNHKDSDVRFNLSATSLGEMNTSIPRKLRLSWRTPPWTLKDGQTIHVLVKTKPIHGLANEGGFLYQKWLFSEGIIASGYVRTHADNRLIANVVSQRQQVFDRIMQIADVEHKWLVALAIGYRGLLTSDDWQLVQTTGVAHLIAISGLHVGLVAGFSYFVIAWLLAAGVSRFPALHIFNLHAVGLVLAFLVCVWYSHLAGFALPTVRALIMLGAFTALFISNKSLAPITVLLGGICLFIVLFPLSLFGSSFWLSFSAVMIIWLVLWRWPPLNTGFSVYFGVMSLVRIQLALTLLMLPIIAWQFSYISVVSPFANLIAIPVVTFVLIPACLLGVALLPIAPSLAAEVFRACDWIIEWGITGLMQLSELSWAYFTLHSFPIWVWGMAMLGLIWLGLPKCILDKRYSLIVFLPLLTYGFRLEQPTIWRLTVLDVGQGLSVLIQANNKLMVYDVGASYPSGFNMADSVILPYLRAKGIGQIDYVLLSHGDNDHAGSLAQLKAGTEVQHVISNQDLCRAGWAVNWQGLSLKALWPDNPAKYNDNNGSCVIALSDGVNRVLLTGDIHQEVERQLVALYGKALEADVLIAPHHGSNTSSSAALINAVTPNYVVFSQGFRNRWGFPKPKVIERYQTYSKAHLLATSETGQVSFVFDRGGKVPVGMETFRQDLYPYWHANMPTCCVK